MCNCSGKCSCEGITIRQIPGPPGESSNAIVINTQLESAPILIASYPQKYTLGSLASANITSDLTNTDKDKIKIITYIQFTTYASNGTIWYNIMQNATFSLTSANVIATVPISINKADGSRILRIEIDMSRTSATTVVVEGKASYYSSQKVLLADYGIFPTTSITVASLNSNSCVFTAIESDARPTMTSLFFSAESKKLIV